MKLLDPRFWLTALSAAGVVVLASKDLERTSPGVLAVVHEREPDLASNDGCALCHGGSGESLADACTACHEDVGAHIDLGRGLHGTLDSTLANECATCHSDHHGADFPVVNVRSFKLAGVEDAQRFEHDQIGFAMDGAHLDLACAECHEHAEAAVLPQGARRFIGLRQDCATCHDDPHDGRMARDCTSCHTQAEFLDLHAFAHDKRFPLHGSHSTPGCLDCHDRAPFTIEDLGGKDPIAVDEWRECRDCHASPHAQRFLQGIARLVQQTPGESCETCHTVFHESFDDERATTTRAQHARSGFPLEEPHAELSCADCHPTDLADFAARFPGREAKRCEDCHSDAHRGFFDELMATTAAASAGECQVCHLSTTFTGVPEERFDHGTWTGFPLLGAHRENACESCHPRTEYTDRTHRSFGVVTEHFGRIEGCQTCHTDPHQGDFDGLGVPKEIEGRTGCARCHVETSFRAFEGGFNHKRWTGFALDGAHDELSCSECHTPLRRADAVGRTWGRAAGSACADCHADPHAGQFLQNGENDCARCHQDTTQFAVLAFDHNVHSVFELDETHAALECSACHASGIQAGREVVRYKPLGTECVDCHSVGRRGLQKNKDRKR